MTAQSKVFWKIIRLAFARSIIPAALITSLISAGTHINSTTEAIAFPFMVYISVTALTLSAIKTYEKYKELTQHDN